MTSLANKTLFITGASRGIGLAIALRAARDGANVTVAAKSETPHPKLPGTIYSAAEDIEKERANLLEITKAEGKPEQAWPKIVDGRLNAWFKDQVLLEQGYVKDDKKTITELLGDATLVRFAQVFIGA